MEPWLDLPTKTLRTTFRRNQWVKTSGFPKGNPEFDTDSFKSISLSGCQLEDDTFPSILQKLEPSSSLIFLDISNNLLTNQAFKMLSIFTHSLLNFRSLNVSNNLLRIGELSSEIASLRHVQELDLSKNVWASDSERALRSLLFHKSLLSLSMNAVEMDAELTKTLREFLSDHECSLREIQLIGADITNEEREEILGKNLSLWVVHVASPTFYAPVIPHVKSEKKSLIKSLFKKVSFALANKNPDDIEMFDFKTSYRQPAKQQEPKQLIQWKPIVESKT
eukprot:CAMPEP_0115045774 /NCGR_PEP_ID=MMETSP0216-20121206/48353_1 /TAXON_ID=223996 /ORGANISM="Protocruzia adherens, Strain Boccale" /LENGTH=278 /DNA_ID=CAMNT_0002428727 /DNA_START=213 /DNA_END=1045 /DNA_ORIENTATION=+